MKLAIIATLIAVTSALHLSAAELFGTWRIAHNRSYMNADEASTRRRYFQKNYAQIQVLNKIHSHLPNGAVFQPNKFADWSPAELKRLRGFRLPANARELLPNAAPVTEAAAATVDWRVRGIVSPIQDQGQCGSCWAFSATANVESRWAIAKSTAAPKLAEQFLVDCDHQCGNYRDGQDGCDAGCDGGLMPNAWKYVISNGFPSEQAYPYTGVDGTCAAKSLRSLVNISSWELLPIDETAIAAYVSKNGPVSIAVDAAQWSFYMGGIMSLLCWGKTTVADLDHGVNIVGYGTEDSTDYWIVRNSWSSSWGESGYARVLRGSNFCGLALFACSSIV